MSTSTPSRPFTTLRSKAGRFIVIGVALSSAALLSMTGMSYADENMHGGPMMAMHGMHGAADPAKMEKHLDRMLDHMVPDLTAAQKTSIKGITTAAATDMKTFHDQHKTLHTAEINILTAATVDRTALEQNRVDAMRLMEQMSKRKNLALADAADVLTPAQRAKVGETLKARMAKHVDHSAASMMQSPFGK